MRIRSFLCCAVFLALAPATAVAERSPQYFGIQGGTYEYEPGTGRVDDEVVRLKYGYEFSKFLAVEGHIGADTGPGQDTDGRVNLREGAIFGRFQLPYDRVNVYFLAGAASLGGDFGDGRERDKGPAAGIGIDLFGTENSALSIEYLRYEVDDDGQDNAFKALTLGWKHHFEWPAFR